MRELPDNPVAICLCPTYGRPTHLLMNTIACFQAQTYQNKRLLICDDLGNLVYRGGIPNVFVESTPERYPSLPAKYNSMLAKVTATDSVIIVWEDDDLYLPHHIQSNVDALKRAEWAHPVDVWSTYTGKPEIEGAAGRFHASLAFRADFLKRIGGWPDTVSPMFDQMLIATAAQNTPCGRPNSDASAIPSYVFRWADTQSPHGQVTMGSGDSWYYNYHPQNTLTTWLYPKNVRYDDAAVQTIAAINARTAAR